MTKASEFSVSDDDKGFLVAGLYAESFQLMTISNLASQQECDDFAVCALSDGFQSESANSRLQILIEGLDEVSQVQLVKSALMRTKHAISKYSSKADKPDDYFWFMVEQVHGKDGSARLKSLSNKLRKVAKTMQKEKVAA